MYAQDGIEGFLVYAVLSQGFDIFDSAGDNSINVAESGFFNVLAKLWMERKGRLDTINFGCLRAVIARDLIAGARAKLQYCAGGGGDQTRDSFLNLSLSQLRGCGQSAIVPIEAHNIENLRVQFRNQYLSAARIYQKLGQRT